MNHQIVVWTMGDVASITFVCVLLVGGAVVGAWLALTAAVAWTREKVKQILNRWR